ncbi:MAG: hypothetical protein H6935_10285 [Thiobacillus sp.]|nr:hypothetical protein [Thiobacillus sp.]
MATIARTDNDTAFLVDLGVRLLLKVGKSRARLFLASYKVPATVINRVVEKGIYRPLSDLY